ncbi:bifunctional oligoribonuclease/PAP phosphatase NrnA [soil metagenome]
MPQTDPDFNKVLKEIKLSQSIVITTHKIPDGDALGSELALFYYLKSLHKSVTIINHSRTPLNLGFIENNLVNVFEDDESENLRRIREADLLILTDTNRYERAGITGEIFMQTSTKKICIDHHMDINKKLFNYILSDEESPSTCQIIFEMLKHDKEFRFTEEISSALYLGIMTDTGGFRYPRTDKKTFLAAAELVDTGADPVELYDRIYSNETLDKLKLKSVFISNIKISDEGKVAIGTLFQTDIIGSGVSESDLEGFTTILMEIRGVIVGIKILELNNGFKLSFRSKSNFIKMNLLAEEFGGGGHIQASGATVRGESYEEIVAKLHKLLPKYIN